MKLKLISIIVGLGALSAPALASTESVTLNFNGRQLSGLSEVHLKDELKAQHPELNVDELSLVGLEVSGRIDGEEVAGVNMPVVQDGSRDPWILATEGQVELNDVKIELAKSGGGQVIIRRGGYYDSPGYYDGGYNRPVYPRRGYYPRPRDPWDRGGVIIVPGRDRDRDRGDRWNNPRGPRPGRGDNGWNNPRGPRPGRGDDNGWNNPRGPRPGRGDNDGGFNRPPRGPRPGDGEFRPGRGPGRGEDRGPGRGGNDGPRRGPGGCPPGRDCRGGN